MVLSPLMSRRENQPVAITRKITVPDVACRGLKNSELHIRIEAPGLWLKDENSCQNGEDGYASCADPEQGSGMSFGLGWSDRLVDRSRLFCGANDPRRSFPEPSEIDQHIMRRLVAVLGVFVEGPVDDVQQLDEMPGR